MTSKEDQMKYTQIDSEWTELKDDSVYAPWEKLITAIIDENSDVLNQFPIGNLKFDKAAQTLDSEVDEIESIEHAEALLEALCRNKIIGKKDNNIILFKNRSGEPEIQFLLYNLAAAIQLICTKIQRNTSNIADNNVIIQKNKEHGIYGEEQANIELADEIEDLNQIHRAFNEYEKQLRTTIRANLYDHGNVSGKEYQNILINILAGIKTLDQRANDMNPHNIKSTVNSLSDIIENTNIGIQDTDMVDMSHEEIENILNELTDSRDKTYQAGEEITDEAKDDQVEEEFEGQTKEAFADNFEE